MKKLLLALPLAAVLAVSMVLTPSAFASGGQAKNNPDFQITDIEDNVMTVAGTAGVTIPKDNSHVFAYMWVTGARDPDTGVGCGNSDADICGIAATSHKPDDSGQVVDNLDWHTHEAEFTGGCVSFLDDGDQTPTMSGSTVTLNGGDATAVDSSNAGLTAVLNIDREAGTVCVQHIISTFGL